EFGDPLCQPPTAPSPPCEIRNATDSCPAPAKPCARVAPPTACRGPTLEETTPSMSSMSMPPTSGRMRRSLRSAAASLSLLVLPALVAPASAVAAPAPDPAAGRTAKSAVAAPAPKGAKKQKDLGFDMPVQ